jgi:hypothetical protein
MFINKSENIMNQEHRIRGRLSYIKLCNTANSEIKNIFSYYGKARNSIDEWKQNFQIIQNKMIDNDLENVVLMRDFNFITSVLDRNTQYLNSIDNAAIPQFIELQNAVNVIDSFRISNPKRRLYSYYHTDGKSKSRIDRIYTGVELSLRVEATHLEFSKFSDHKILRLRIGNNVERGPGSWIFNTTLLNDTYFCNKMVNEIRASGNFKHSFTSKRNFWDYLKMNMQSEAIQYSSDIAKEKRHKQYKINRELEELEQIPSNLLSDYSLRKIENIKKLLSNFEKKK